MAENVTPIGGFSQAGAEMLREMADNTTVYAECVCQVESA